jgi:hypothetical protein
MYANYKGRQMQKMKDISPMKYTNLPTREQCCKDPKMNGCLFLEKKKSLNIKKIISLS